MNNFRRFFRFTTAFLLILCFALPLFSQAGSNPNDRFYDAASRWESLGLIDKLPQFKPYPIELIDSILKQVIRSYQISESELALEFYEEIFGKKINIFAEGKGYGSVSTVEDAEKQIIGSAGVEGNLKFGEWLGFSYNLNFVGLTDYDKHVLPMYKSTDVDIAADPMSVKNIKLYANMNSVFSANVDDLYVSGGISRVGFGPLYNTSIVYSPDTMHTSYFSLMLKKKFWNYTQAIFTLGATNNLGQTNSATYIYPEKYMALHSLDFYITPFLTFTYYENIIFGERLELSYLFPVPYMIAQGIDGFRDNLQMGTGLRYYPAKGLKLTGDVFIDDISMNDLVKLHLDTKIKAAGQLGVEYVPQNSIFTAIRADVTAVTPWMYTHSQYYTDNNGKEVFASGKGVNYQNYSHFGQCLATTLWPNSDRFHYEITINPIKRLRIDFFSDFIRHANINESLPVDEAILYLNAKSGEFRTDGSIFNYPDAGKGHLASALNNFEHMEQATKMYICQTGVGFSMSIPVNKYGILSFSVKDTLEYIKNWGVQNEIYIPIEGGNATAEDVANAIKTWRDNIIPEVLNNYLQFSVKYMY